jgi:hypothetical protein
MSRPLVTNNWRKLSKASRNERDPKKFVRILKQLYDVIPRGHDRVGSWRIWSSPRNVSPVATCCSRGASSSNV